MITGTFLFMGQKSQDNPQRWNIDPSMSRIYPSGEYSPLPQIENQVFSTSDRIIPTPIGTFAVSPNFRVHPSAGTQSETPIVRHPSNQLIMLGSANTYRGGSTFSTGVYVTTDGGVTWFGSDTLNNGGFNSGDPGPVIDKDGRFLMSYITTAFSMGASYSTNNGINWAPTVTFPGATTSADKNLSGTDDAPSSAFYGRSYTVYTEFGGTYVNRIVLSYTSNGGVSWSTVAPVSPPTSTGHHHQGCDVRCGPNGEVYVVWANCTTNGQNSTEDSLGVAKSTNGGVNWVFTKNNANNMNGIRTSGLINGIRANGFPRIDVDRSGGPRNGWVYVVTAEKTIAPATDVSDVILHKSTDGGVTWAASRVNQDAAGNGKYQYMPAVRVDEYGGVNVVYYDTRNIPTNDSAQIYVSRSIDGGSTWSDILVSDHKFKPKPISGLAGGYQGDYIGITSGNGKVWPYWCEDITGAYQAWTASIDIGPAITHTPLPNTEQLSGNYIVNCVITPAGVGINPSKTKLFWSRNNPSITDSVLMTNPSGNNWTANIPGNGAAATYRYYISTTDSINRNATSPNGAPVSLHSFIASTDNTSPVITHTPLPDQPKPVWPSTVSATVTDNLGLDSVWVRWYINSPSVIKHFRLNNTGGSGFSAQFNSLNADVNIGDNVFYKIYAQDNSLAHNRDSIALNSFEIIDQFLCEGFYGAAFPPDFWTLDFSGTQYWTRNSVSSYGIGSGSAKFDFWNASSGTQQSLISLAFSASVPGDSLKFDHAYAPYPSGIDSLIIETSTNAGTSYTTLVRMWGSASGGPLNTAATLSTEFTPTSAQWATKRYTLPTGTNMVKFRAYSGFGNNLYIDSICKVQGDPPPPPPVINTSDDSIVVNLAFGSNTTNRNLAIQNTGGSVLNWSLTELSTLADKMKTQNPFSVEDMIRMMNQPKGAEDIYHGPEVYDGQGGPDGFGYIWIDSDEPGGPVYNYADISGVGTPITAWSNNNGDDGYAVVSLPFNFNYYGTDYTQLKICTNGWVSFDVTSTDVSYTNTVVPAAAQPNNALYALWDDLDVRTTGTVYHYYDAPNNRFIIEYKNVPHYSSGGPYTFEIILQSDGQILYQYSSITAPDNSLTIGNENASGNDGLQMVFNNTYVHNNLAILIKVGGIDWVDEDPVSGSVPVSGNQNVDVEFNSTGLAIGTYTGLLKIASNDPVTPLKNVLVKLNVGLSIASEITLALEGFYNNSINALNLRDTTKIYLRNTSSPYTIVDSATGVIDSLTFTGSFLFQNAPSGTYYLQVITRNGVETWSKNGGEVYVQGSLFTYDFTTSASQAYGNNQNAVSSYFMFFSGDINGDGVVDGFDLGGIDNDAANFTTGYLDTDLNGDYIIDGVDQAICDNNAANFIAKSVPPGAGPTKATNTTKQSKTRNNKESDRKISNDKISR